MTITISNYCNGLLYVFPTRIIVNFVINFTFLTATYLPKARYSLFVLKTPINQRAFLVVTEVQY